MSNVALGELVVHFFVQQTRLRKTPESAVEGRQAVRVAKEEAAGVSCQSRHRHDDHDDDDGRTVSGEMVPDEAVGLDAEESGDGDSGAGDDGDEDFDCDENDDLVPGDGEFDYDAPPSSLYHGFGFTIGKRPYTDVCSDDPRRFVCREALGNGTPCTPLTLSDMRDVMRVLEYF